MPGFLREHSWPIAFSVALHGLLVAAFAAVALISIKHTLPTLQPIPVDAVVVDSQVLHAAQQALVDRAQQEAARRQAAAEAKVAAEAAEAKAATDAQMAAQEERAAEEAKQAAAEAARTKQAVTAKVLESQRVAEAKRIEELKHAADAKRAEDAKHAEEAKRATDTKQAEDAKHAADLQAKAEREAELRKQLADEEHVSQVEASPARAQWNARLASRIQNAWIKPPSARAGLDCIVNITQIPGGEVTSAHVSQCNGDAAARQSIENAVYRASPLPAPPDPALFRRELTIHFHPDE
jgi:colicin import membrane protein